VAAALALLVFSVNWAGFLIIAALPALYEYGLHWLRPPEPAAPPPATACMMDASSLLAAARDLSDHQQSRCRASPARGNAPACPCAQARLQRGAACGLQRRPAALEGVGLAGR
jgi:hypothetical protein